VCIHVAGGVDGALVALGTAVVVSYGYFCYVPKLIITG
jgi:hypothetical protein